MEVTIIDDATGSCWTNLLESKKYAEDKLKLLGVNVSSDPDIFPSISEKIYELGIHVHARRSSDYCFGKIKIFIGGYAYINGKRHYANIYDEGLLVLRYNSLNNAILDFISDAFKGLK